MNHPHTGTCPNVRKGEAYTPEQCGPCWHFLHTPAVNAARGGTGVLLLNGKPAAAPIVILPCIYRGGPTGDTATCAEGCGAGSRLKVTACEVHGRCTLGKRGIGIGACCRDCTDRVEIRPRIDYPPIGLRHLVYHLLPAGTWRKNVAALRKRWSLFTGRKLIAVMTGVAATRTHGGDEARLFTIDPPQAVREALPADAEIIKVQNDPELREVASWVPLWEKVLDGAGDDAAVLYAHAKGVTRPAIPGSPIANWAELLHTVMLDHWPAVEDVLRRHPIAGALKKIGKGFTGSASAWHYSGSFFWVRVGDFRQRAWRAIEQVWHGNESWPGTAYRLDEAGSVFLTRPTAQLDVFQPETWQKVIYPEFGKWLLARGKA